MTTTRWILALALAGSSAGCSLLIDTDPYQTRRDGGGDGGQVDPDAPTAPVVRITPEAPLTADDLVMEVVTESTDPLSAGPVTYAIEWLRDGEDADLEEATVPADETSKGEEWTVRVIPTSADGERTGAAGTASVTIGNSPPSASYVGLADYRPIAGTTLESLTGPVTDPDGDLTQIVFTWLRDGTPLEGEDGPRLTLDASVPAGARITLRVTPRDSEDAEGAPIETGEAIVVEDVVRWRQLAPDRHLDEGGYIVYDAPNRRALLIYRVDDRTPTDVRVWEYALEATGNRWVELHPAGDALSIYRAAPLLDVRNRRLLFFEGYDEDNPSSNRVFALDLAVRGAERWSELTPSGGGPPGRAWATMGYDGERQQVIFYGGGTAAGPLTDLWMLDVSRPGFEAWTEIEHSSTADIGGALVLVDEERDRALFVGGIGFTTGTPALLNTIYTLDLASPEEGPVLTSGTLPAALFFGMATIDDERDRALVGLGGSGLSGEPSPAMYAIDLETLTAEEVTPTGTPPTAGFLGSMTPDPYEPGRVIVYPGPPAFDGSGSTPRFDLYEMDAATLEVAPIHRYDVDAPPTLDGAISAGNREDLRFFGGETDFRATDGVWRLDLLLGWTRMTTQPDAVTGRSPAARADLSAGEPSFRGLSFFSGIDNGTLADTTTWTLAPVSDTEAEWIERALIPASPIPAARQGASMFDPSCYRQNIGFVGGGRAGASGGAETWVLECTVDDVRGCTWIQLPVTGITPRSHATIVRDDTDHLLFGGTSTEDGALLNDVWRLVDVCNTTASWARVSVAGTPPMGRYRHTMTRADSGAIGVSRWVIFGGVVDRTRPTPETDEAWILENAGGTYRWERVAVAAGPNDSVIDARAGHVATWGDERNPRLIVYGGSTNYFTRSDLWELRFPPAP